jgi:ATP-dependent RNA helicase DeaD
LLDLHDVRYGLIFGFTKIQVDTLTEALVARGYSADKLHGDMTQAMRDRVMKRFRERRIELLVATDVAARGLDVDDLEIVFNYELPHDAEDYVHRIGRTGRAGKSGRAISLVSGREYGRLQQIIRFTKSRIPRDSIPKLEDLEEKHANRLVESLHHTIQSGEFKRQDKVLEDLIEAGHAPGEIVSALMHLLTGESSRTPERILEDDPRQRRGKRPLDERKGDVHSRDEGEQRERPRRSAPEAPAPRSEADATRIDESGLWLKFNIGDNAGVAPGDFVGCIANEAQVPRTVIGGIRIMATVSFVQVASEFAEHIMASVQGARLRGRTVQVAPGMPPRRDFNPGGKGGPRRPGQGRRQ